MALPRKIRFTLGQGSECDVIIVDDPHISKVHAIIGFLDHDWWVVDNGATNGTFVTTSAGLTRVTTAVKLLPDQLVCLGLRTTIRWESVAFGCQ